MIRRIVPRLVGAALVIALGWMALPGLTRAAPEEDKPLGKVPSDLALVPRDAGFFLSMRHAELMATPPAKAMALTPAFRYWERTLKSLKLAPKDVERVTMFQRVRSSDQEPITIIRTVKAFDADDMAKKMGLDDEMKAHGKTFRTGSTYDAPAAVWFADDKTMVTGDPRVLVPYLAVMEKPGKGHVFADELEAAAGTHSLTLAVLPSRITSMQPALEKARQDRWKKDRMKGDFKEFKKDEKRPLDGPPPPKEGPFEVKEKEKIGARMEDRFVRYQPKEVYYKEKDGGYKERYVPRRPRVRPDDLKEKALEPGTLDEAFDSMDRWGPMSAPFRPAMRCQRLLVTLDVDEEMSAKAKATFATEAEAKDGLASAKMLLVIARDMLPQMFRFRDADSKSKELADAIKEAQAILRAAETAQDGKIVTASAKGKIDTKALAKYIAEQVPVVTDSNNLKQIGIAFHSMSDSRGGFARAICDPAGKPLLSWRVAILPYIEQGELYRQFKLDEPWDSPHNKKLLGKMPAVFAPVKGAAAEPDATHYQVFGGPGTLFPKPDTRTPVWRIPDGSSNTFLVAESSRAVPWTKPADMEVTEKTLPALGGQFPKFLQVLMCDGSVRRIKRGADEKLLRWAIDPNDGNHVDLDDLKP